MDDKQLQALYNEMSSKLDLGDFSAFKNQVSSDAKFRKAFFTEASSVIDLGDYNTFESSFKKKDGGNISMGSPSPSPSALQRLDELKKQLNLGKLTPQRTELPAQVQKAKQKAEFIEAKEKQTPKVSQMMVYSKPTFKVEYPEQDELTAKVLGFQSAQQKDQFEQEDKERQQQKAQQAADEFYNTSTGKLYYNIIKPLADAGGNAIKGTAATVSRLAGNDDLADAIVNRFTPEKQYKGTIAGNTPTKLQGGLFNDGKMNTAKLPSTIVRGLADMSFLLAPIGPSTKLGQAAGLTEKTAQGASLVASSFLQSRENYYQDGKSAGLKGEQLDNFANLSAALTASLEALFPNQIALGNFKKKMASQYAKQIANGVTAKAAFKAGVKEVLKESIVKEPVQELFQLGGDKVAKVISDMSSGENNFGEQFNWEKSKDEIYETLVVTPMVSFLASGPGALNNYTPSNYEKAIYFDAAKNADKVKQFLDNQYIEKQIDETQYKNAKQRFNNYLGSVNQVKNLGYSEDQSLQMAWEVFSGKEKLPTTQSVIADPILKDALGGEIKKDKEAIADNIRMIGMGIPSVGSEIEGKELAYVISNIGDKGTDIGQSLVDNIGDDAYRVEEVDVKELYNNDSEFKQYVENYKKGSVSGNTLLVPAVIKDGKIVDGRARLAEQYLSGNDKVKVFRKLSPSLELSKIENIEINKSAILDNTATEVERLKTAELDPDDGVTLNMDGTKYEGGGLIVPVGSMNTTQEELTPELIADFAEQNKNKLSSGQTFKFGLYKFPGSNQVSIDLNIVTDPKNKDLALEFGKRAGQESLFDLSSFSNIPTGADGQNPVSFNDEQIREIGKAFEEGRMPNVFGKKIADELMAELGSPIEEVLAQTIPMVEKSLQRTGIRVNVVDGTMNTAEAIAARGNQGLFIAQDGTIIIDKSKLANQIEAGLVVWHEASHPVMNIIRNTNKELYNKVVRGLITAARQDKNIANALNWARSQPEYDNIDTQNDEAIVETIGRINSGLIDINSLGTSLRQSLIDFVNSIAKFFGIDQILDNTDLEEFKRVSSEVADALRSGRDISSIVGNDNVGRFENTLTSSGQARRNAAQVAIDTEKKTVDGKVQPSMILMGKQKGKDVEIYSGPASIQALRSSKPDMYVSRAEEISKSALVKGKPRSYRSDATLDQKLKWADKIYSEAKATVVSNLNYIYDQIPPEIRDISKLWYDGANIIAQKLANKYNTSLEQASAVIATQSPQKPWYDNVHLAHFIMDFYANKQSDLFTQEMYDYYRLKSEPTKANPKGYPKQEKYLATLKKSIGKKFSDLSNYDKSVMIRAEFDNKYERRAPLRIPTGDIVGRVNSMSSFSGYDTIAKGVSILEDGSEQNISSNLGKAFKVRNFNNNIANPKMDGEVTIDTHAMAAAYMLPLGSSSPEVKFDEATYAFFADAYRESAKQKGVLAREMQSIVWEGVRSVFPASDKSDANKAKAKEIWSNYKNGSLSLSDVQEKIKANGKDLSITDWSRFSDRILEEDGQLNYLEELPLAIGDKSAAGLRDGSGNSRRLPRMGEGSLQSNQASVGNRGELLAPNGKPSKLTPAQYKQVRTPQFKNWFGDWENDPENASKVVDENGEPLVVYHGTSKDKDFNKFNVPDRGAWFTDDPKEASNYAVDNDNMRSNFDFFTGQSRDQNTSSRVIPVFLNIRKLYNYETDVSQEDRDKMKYAKSYRSVQRDIFRRLYSDAYSVGQPNVSGINMGGGIYVALGNANQIKSAVGNSGEFSNSVDKLQASVGNRDIINGFYSPIEDRINTFKQPKASVQKWKEIVGVKSDEAVYSGMSDWLGGKKTDQQLSKEEVLQFMKDNRIEIKEIVKGKGGKMSQEQMDDVYNGVREQLANMDMIDDVDRVRNNPLDVWYNDPTDENYDALGDFLDERGIDLNFIADADNDGTKYSQYQLPGGENYKEVLITLPSEVSKLREEFNNKYPDWGTKPFDEVFSKEDATRFQKALDKSEFNSSHFDESNIITHLRMNTRTDADGNKVLFLEEVQSDWGQKGKKEGFIKSFNRDNSEYIPKYFEGGIYKDDVTGERYNINAGWKIVKKDINEAPSIYSFRTEEYAWEEIEENYSRNKVQSAPYVTNTNAWVKLGLKVALKEAVRQGADRIAWTTGQQQNERYDLRKQVDEITYRKLDDGNYRIIAYKDLNAVERKDVPESGLEAAFGKDVAERIINGVGDFNQLTGITSLTGLNLSVGGKGMKAFYGDAQTPGIVANVAKALVKELTGKEGQIVSSKISSPRNQDVIDRYNRARQYGNVPEALAKEYEQAQGLDSEQPAIDITPELAYAVQGGMPQFSVGNRPELSREFKIAAFVMRKKGEGESDADIVAGVSSATGMSADEVRSIIADPEAYIRKSFPELSEIAQDNLIERANIQNIYRGHNTPVNPAFTGMEVPMEKVVDYLNKSNKIDKSFKDEVKEFKNKWLNPSRGLPDWVMAIKDFSAGSKNIEIARAVKTIERLKDEAKKIGFTDWDAFSKAMVAVRDVRRVIPDESGLTLFDPYRAAAGKMFTTPDNMLPAVIPDELKAIPESLRPFAVQMRQQIDGITKDLIGSGYVTPEQAVTLEQNIGQYVNRSYKMFNERGYKPTPDQIREAVKFLADQKIKKIVSELFPADKKSKSKAVSDFKGNVNDPDNVNMDLLYDQAIEEAKKDVQAILDKNRNPFFNQKTDSRDTGILKEKKDIPEPIRKLMGEYTDPGTVFVMTVAKQAALKAQSEYLTKLREFGMGTLFFEENDPKRPAEFSVKVATDGTESKSPLGGLYTTPEIADALEMADPTYNELTQLWMKLVGAVRWGKTVGSVVTQFKNFESNLGFAVLNGLLMTGNNTEAFKGAAKYVKGQYTKQEIDEITEKLIKLNLVGQSVGTRELAEMLGSGDIHDIALDIAVNPNNAWGKKVKKKVNVISALNKAYRMGDDFWKAYAYLNERQVVSQGRFKNKYEDLTADQQEKVDIEASERVKNTWPTYDRVVEGAKFVSKRAPIFGNFISFQAESIRVLVNSIKMAREDMRDPEMKSAGVKRMAGIASYMAIRALITTTVAHAAGMAASGLLGAAIGDDEEEQKKRALKKALPVYARTADIAAIPNSKEPHKYTVFSLSSLDPYGIIPNSLNALTEGREGIFSKEMEPGVLAALAEFFSGFLEPEMTFSTMYSVSNNINPKTGRPIVTQSDTSPEIAKKVGSFIIDQLEPSTISLIERGIERGWAPELASFAGARPIDVDLHKSFGYILSDMSKQMDAISSEYGNIKRNEDIPQAEKDEAEKKAEAKKAFLISKTSQVYRDFIKAGANSKILDDMINERSPIKMTGFDKTTKKGIKTGDVNSEKLFK